MSVVVNVFFNIVVLKISKNEKTLLVLVSKLISLQSEFQTKTIKISEMRFQGLNCVSMKSRSFCHLSG